MKSKANSKGTAPNAKPVIFKDLGLAKTIKPPVDPNMKNGGNNGMQEAFAKLRKMP